MPLFASVLLLALGGTTAIGQERPDSAAADSVYSETKVDKRVVLRREFFELFYPIKQRKAGVEGCVIVQFVANVDGRADMSTFKVLWSTHPDFTTEVRRAVMKSRYEPAELRGRKVKQLIEQPFMFTLTYTTGGAGIPLPPERRCAR